MAAAEWAVVGRFIQRAVAAAAAAEAQGAKYPVINDPMIEMETYANSNGLSVRILFGQIDHFIAKILNE